MSVDLNAWLDIEFESIFDLGQTVNWHLCWSNTCFCHPNLCGLTQILYLLPSDKLANKIRQLSCRRSFKITPGKWRTGMHGTKEAEDCIHLYLWGPFFFFFFLVALEYTYWCLVMIPLGRRFFSSSHYFTVEDFDRETDRKIDHMILLWKIW